MEKAQARRWFKDGKLHPHCPACGEKRLVNVSLASNNSIDFRGYVCARCRQPFVAWIDK